jgi:hypothetical protein
VLDFSTVPLQCKCKKANSRSSDSSEKLYVWMCDGSPADMTPSTPVSFIHRITSSSVWMFPFAITGIDTVSLFHALVESGSCWRCSYLLDFLDYFPVCQALSSALHFSCPSVNYQ